MTLFASRNPTSDLDVVNIALAQLGQDSISSFDENNKRARISNALYPSALRSVLTRGQWTFARRLRQLQQIPDANVDTKLFPYVYLRPSDAVMSIGLVPLTRRIKWEMINGQIHTGINPAYLYYISSDTPPSDYTPPFVTSLSFYLAAMLAYPLTQDDELGQNMLTRQFPFVLAEALSADAMIGSEHLQADRDPRNDTFVTSGEEERTITEEDIMFATRYILPEQTGDSGTFLGNPFPVEGPT
jgi:hypothetical protein